MSKLTDSRKILFKGVLLSLLFGHLSQASVAVTNVGCPNISVSSLENSTSFFEKVLDFRSVKKEEDVSNIVRSAPGMPKNSNARSLRLTLGDECIELTEYKNPKGADFIKDSHGNDLWFEHIAIVVSDMDKAYARLKDARVRFVSNVPQTLPEWNKNASGISAFYFRDPDGHYLELIHFPTGKGQSKWQGHNDRLFLGIDHTAITVANTERSLAFYRDHLHLRVAGGSENYGIEQEHLSGVFNAHVVITSLRADSGIGIEFLEYLSPAGGRESPSKFKISDIPVWQIVMDVSSKESSEDNILSWRTIREDDHKKAEIAWMKDPDGHVIRVVKKN
jgi:catechol 2,3-dioxygenase-like lactoylglutathione lyase family enzyme